MNRRGFLGLTTKALIGLPLITLAPVLKAAGMLAGDDPVSVRAITRKIEAKLEQTARVTGRYKSYFAARELQSRGLLHEAGIYSHAYIIAHKGES